MFWLAVAAVALTSCAPSNDELRAKLDQRARFDLSCSSIYLQPLEETSGYTMSYGVTGCGRRVTYVLNATTQSWVMNVDEGRPTGQAPAEAPPPHMPPPMPPR
jgi:hypothetical protein